MLEGCEHYRSVTSYSTRTPSDARGVQVLLSRPPKTVSSIALPNHQLKLGPLRNGGRVDSSRRALCITCRSSLSLAGHSAALTLFSFQPSSPSSNPHSLLHHSQLSRLVFFPVLVRFLVTIKCSPHKRWREKLASQSTCSENFYTYISLDCFYVVRLRIMTLPFGLGIHDDANQTSGGRTPSFSIFTS